MYSVNSMRFLEFNVVKEDGSIASITIKSLWNVLDAIANMRALYPNFISATSKIRVGNNVISGPHKLAQF